MPWLFALSTLAAAVCALAWRVERKARAGLERRLRAESLDGHAERQRLAAYVAAMPLAAAVFDADGRVRAWNPGAEALFGWRAGDILGRDGPDRLVDDASRPTFQAALAQTLAGGGLRRELCAHRTRDGRRLHCEWTHAPLRDAAGHVTAVASLARDVSERTRHERLRTARNRALQRLASDLELDALLVELAGDVASLRRGLTVAVQRTVSHCGLRRLELVRPDELAPGLRRVLSNAPVVAGKGACGSASAEARRVVLLDAPGHPFCERLADDLRSAGVRSWWAEPIVAADGSVLGVLSVFDAGDDEPDADELELVEACAQLAALTVEHRQQRAELDGSRLWLRQVIDALPHRVQARDERGRVLLANRTAARVLGCASPEELVGRSLHELLTDTERVELQLARDREALARGDVVDEDELVRDADGRVRELVTTRVPFERPDGLGRAVVCVSVDVTEARREQVDRENLAARVQDAQKLESLGVLAGGMAHDFNNLLVSILGNAELVGLELPESGRLRESLADLQAAARHAADLCRQMLAYSGRGAFVVEPVDLNGLVRDMVQLLGHALSKKTELHLALGDGLPAVMADATQLRQVVMNLLTNASEALRGDRGDVTLRTRVVECDRAQLDVLSRDPEQRLPEGRYVSLDVSDTGCGMDADTVARIFDPFFTTKFTGRGLGLGAVQGIVRGHGGVLSVQSELGEGTHFRVLLPVIDVEVPEPQGPPTTPQPPSWRGSGTILLVDDEPGIRRVGRRLLESLGFDVLVAEDGRRALKLFGREHRRLRAVLLDLTMPDLDGDEVFERMLQADRGVPVILCSGYDEQDVTSRLGAARPAAFLAKPFERGRLVEVLESALGVSETTPTG